MKLIYLFLLISMIFAGCASKFDQRSYDRQNDAAQKSLDTL
jgi:PBP1b-binding outer membrane lipoprotein LpoB